MTDPRVLESPFMKGHGTENDFVVLPDAEGAVWPDDRLTPDLVRRLCDRRSGIGGDGVLRVVRSAHVPDAPAALGEQLRDCEWFMDHRNADGSTAEMCGNGIRLFLHVLLALRLLDRATAEKGVLIGTRGGPRRVGAGAGGYWVDMGPARPFGQGKTAVAGQVFDGLAVSMGNPHLACLTDVPVGRLDLTGEPGFDAALFPDGVNVELINVLPDDGDRAHIRLRVVERGVGETRSCGTGACAAAYAALDAAGKRSGEVLVDVPGGRLTVRIDPETTVLSGPAVVVAGGSLMQDWLGV